MQYSKSRFKGHSVYAPYMPDKWYPVWLWLYHLLFVQYNRGIFNEMIGIFEMAPIDWMAPEPEVLSS